MVTLLALACMFGGCARAETELARVRAHISLRDLPPAAPPGAPPRLADCGPGYTAADLSRERLTELGGVMLAGLGSPGRPWRYERAGVYARHLRPKDPMREELLDNGTHTYAAHFLQVIVPGGHTVTITLNEPRLAPAAALVPGGVTRFGGYLAADGELQLRCRADTAETTYPLGIVVEGPRCVAVTVQLDDRAPASRSVPFGQKSCP